MNKKGFSLVELLAVIVVIAILIVIGVPTVMTVVNEAKKTLFGQYVTKMVTKTADKYLYDRYFGTALDAGIYIYNIKKDLDEKNTGNYEGYVIVDATDLEIPQYIVSINDNNYMIKNYNYSHGGVYNGIDYKPGPPPNTIIEKIYDPIRDGADACAGVTSDICYGKGEVINVSKKCNDGDEKASDGKCYHTERGNVLRYDYVCKNGTQEGDTCISYETGTKELYNVSCVNGWTYSGGTCQRNALYTCSDKLNSVYKVNSIYCYGCMEGYTYDHVSDTCRLKNNFNTQGPILYSKAMFYCDIGILKGTSCVTEDSTYMKRSYKCVASNGDVLYSTNSDCTKTTIVRTNFERVAICEDGYSSSNGECLKITSYDAK